jgi:putative Mg2+ transporter-C (MgtC) family protein
MLTLAWTELSLRLVMAAVFGAAIGMERERKEWAAGVRTHMMVCVGSALMMLVSSYGFADTLGMKDITLDPSRVAAQIISGIGFIGAGTILFLKPAKVLGLTTASGLWTVAGIGMATGGGMYFAASATTVLSIIILWGMQPLQRKFSPKFQQKSLTIITNPDTNPKSVLDRLLEDKNVDFSNLSVTKMHKELVIELKLDKPGSNTLIQIINNLQEDPQVKKISWNR